MFTLVDLAFLLAAVAAVELAYSVYLVRQFRALHVASMATECSRARLHLQAEKRCRGYAHSLLRMAMLLRSQGVAQSAIDEICASPMSDDSTDEIRVRAPGRAVEGSEGT